MRIRVRAIILKDSKLLLVQHKKPDGTAYDTWVLPGGGVDDGELLMDAMHREMIEETGIAPHIGRLLYVHQFERGGRAEGPEFFFEITNADDYLAIDLSATTHGELEIAEIGFKDPAKIDNVLPAFLVDVAKDGLPESTQFVTIRGGDHY